MELNVLLDCEPDGVPLLREVVDGAGLTVRSDGEAPVLVVDLPVLEHVALVDQVEDLWKRLHELVKSVSGACKLVNGQEDRDVRLQNVFYEDDDGERQWLPISGRAHIVLPPLGSVEPDREAQLIGAAMDSSPEIAKALRLFDSGLDWVNLYRILEVVEDAIGGRQALVDSGWVEEGELKRFTLSSNHPAVSGDKARHGVMKGTPMTKMHIQEARALMRGLLRRFIHKSVDESPAAGDGAAPYGS